MHFNIWTKCLSDGVKNDNTRTAHKFLMNFSNDSDVTQQNLFYNALFRMKRWTHHFNSESEQQSMQWNERIGQNCHFITLRNSVFFRVICKQPTTTKMHKIFIAQKTYSACCVLSLATIRSTYYFNFILNRTRSGQELFDCPPYIWHCHIAACFYDYSRGSKKLQFLIVLLFF